MDEKVVIKLKEWLKEFNSFEGNSIDGKEAFNKIWGSLTTLKLMGIIGDFHIKDDPNSDLETYYIEITSTVIKTIK